METTRRAVLACLASGALAGCSGDDGPPVEGTVTRPTDETLGVTVERTLPDGTDFDPANGTVELNVDGDRRQYDLREWVCRRSRSRAVDRLRVLLDDRLDGDGGRVSVDRRDTEEPCQRTLFVRTRYVLDRDGNVVRTPGWTVNDLRSALPRRIRVAFTVPERGYTDNVTLNVWVRRQVVRWD